GRASSSSLARSSRRRSRLWAAALANCRLTCAALQIDTRSTAALTLGPLCRIADLRPQPPVAAATLGDDDLPLARAPCPKENRMTYETILYETSPDHVATVTINRPEVLNSFNQKMCDEFADVWQRVRG